MRDEQLEKIISDIVTPCAWSTPSDLQMAYIVARNVAQTYKAKLAVQEPVVYRFLHPSTKQYIYITDNVPKIKEFEPLYAHPMPSVSQMCDKPVCVPKNGKNEEPTKEQHRTKKNPKLEPIFWVCFVSDGEGWEAPIHHSAMTSEMIKSGRYTPLYIHPIPTDHIPDVGNMVAQSQKPAAWRITAKRFCGDFTKDRDVAQYWLEKEPTGVTPLYLAPTLSLDPSDELIAEIKSIANIRLVNGKAELSNIREIIHAIAHRLSCAS